MATPRDPAAHTVPNKTIDDTTTQPDAFTSAADPQAVEELAGLSTGRGGNPALRHEEDLAQAGEASSTASRGPAAQVAAPPNGAPSAAMPAQSEQQNMQDDSETTESHDLSTDRSPREEHAAGGAGSAEVASATLPIRTSSARAAIRAAPALTGAGSSSTSQRETSSRTRYVGPDGQVVDLGSIMFPHRPSSGTETAPRLSTGRRSSLRHQLSPSRDRSQRHRRETPDFILPRWQPDAEVTLCPICNTQFSIWVRKHHCRLSYEEYCLGSSQFSTRPGLFQDAASSSQQRALPPTPQIAEEDECPVCHRELPATTLPDFEALREQHITACILSHSTYGSPAPGDGTSAAPPPPRRSGMYTYPATEKDCVDDAECTICLEEFAVGVPMARLECLCRFHRACIAAWFVNHPGRCPVHQHDGFGF
ncbi:hypothetical protein MY1884_001003 [Beauveria asiatica]